jgi:hypothetical protein
VATRIAAGVSFEDLDVIEQSENSTFWQKGGHSNVLPVDYHFGLFSK